MTFQPSNSWAAYSEVTGQIDRPVQGRLLVPGVVELDGSRLWWSESAETSRRPGAVLEGFLELAEASPELIRDYARQWGLLKICRHGLPCSHHATARAAADTVSAVNLVNSCAAKHQILKRRNAQEFLRELRLALAAGEADSAGCEPLRPGQTSGLPKKAYAWEPIELWRTFSHQARSILEIADRLKQRKVGDPSDWAVVYMASGRAAPWWDQTLQVERLVLASVLNEWLTLGGVRPSISWRGPLAEIDYVGPNLFSVIALQLAFAVSGGDGISTCSGCGRVYPRQRRPKEGQRNYCPECRRRKIPLRDAKRDERAGISRSRRPKPAAREKARPETRNG